MNLVEAVQSGDRTEALRALAVKLATEIEDAGREDAMAPLAARLVEVLSELDELADDVEDPIEAIKARGATPISAGAKRKADRRPSGGRVDGKNGDRARSGAGARARGGAAKAG